MITLEFFMIYGTIGLMTIGLIFNNLQVLKGKKPKMLNNKESINKRIVINFNMK